MSVYNRKSWYHNGTKHWIHNGRHYHKRLGFFGTKKKFRKKNYEIINNKMIPKKYVNNYKETGTIYSIDELSEKSMFEDEFYF